MVDLSGGQDGPLEHAFSNSVFILPGIIVVTLSGPNMDPSEGGLNLAQAVKEQLKESIKNSDILSLLQRMVNAVPSNPETESIREKLEGILKYYNSLNEEDKAKFQHYVRNILGTKLADKVDEMPLDLTELEGAINHAIMSQIYLVAAVGVVFLILLVFFGYKLYKSIRDKEKKKEEKKKQKQMKKKK